MWGYHAMKMEIVFTGNRKVEARFKEFVVQTDQPAASGGENSAPTPFELFLASLGTCAGIYVKGFCLQRGISTDTMRIVQTAERDPQGLLGKIQLQIQVPRDFPEKYKSALVNAANLCTVKRVMQQPPKFEIVVGTI